MRVSQRIDYAARALVVLALQREGAVLSGASLATRLGLPVRFVEQQLAILAHADILHSVRGAGGGYSLARPARGITLRQIVSALEGDVLDVPRVSDSSVSEAWASAAASLGDALDEITLASLAERQREIDTAGAAVYYI